VIEDWRKEVSQIKRTTKHPTNSLMGRVRDRGRVVLKRGEEKFSGVRTNMGKRGKKKQRQAPWISKKARAEETRRDTQKWTSGSGLKNTGVEGGQGGGKLLAMGSGHGDKTEVMNFNLE